MQREISKYIVDISGTTEDYRLSNNTIIQLGKLLPASSWRFRTFTKKMATPLLLHEVNLNFLFPCNKL